jgi:hypothetical protein
MQFSLRWPCRYSKVLAIERGVRSRVAGLAGYEVTRSEWQPSHIQRQNANNAEDGEDRREQQNWFLVHGPPHRIRGHHIKIITS